AKTHYNKSWKRNAKGRFRLGLLTRLFAPLSAKREQGPHFSASRKTYPIPAGTADSPPYSKQRRESSRKSRENRSFLRAVPNRSGVLTPLLGFRTDRSAP